jgi:hypothetical protein
MPQPMSFFRLWQCILQFALILWVVRVAVAMTVLGLLILGLAPQAQDLFVEFADGAVLSRILRMAEFVVAMFVVWAMPTHYAARLLLDTDERFHQLLAAQRKSDQAHFLEVTARWVPLLLGLLTFVAVLIAIWRSHRNLPILDQTPEVIDAVNRSLAALAALVVLAAAGFIVYVVKRQRCADLPFLRAVKRLNERLTPLWRAISPGLPDPPGSEEEADRDLGRLLLAAIFVGFVAIFVSGAGFAALFFPRATAVPVILGGWLPFLSYLSGAGRQLRAPLIVGLFVLISVLAVVLGDNHSVRRIGAQAAGGPVDISRIPLDAAVTMWMEENKCLGAPATCPRPIVIAAAGGASRAAFFTASIIGYFMQESFVYGLDPNAVRNRLFAISGVSGGSVGAVMVTAALNAKANSKDHPCVQLRFPLWYGEKINNWRDCFEALTSGDFLTANFFGFAFNDMLPFDQLPDRAAVLEDSWDDRYQAVATRVDQATNPPGCKGLKCPFLTLRPQAGHWIPLLILNGTSEATGGRIVTTALAPTYRHSAETGCPTSESSAGCALFAEAAYFHDLLNYNVKPDEGDVLDDVQLSTAALNSARFPFISPAGSVRNRNHTIVDRIVDGGYFENYGALSAKELALAVHAIQPKLAPFVLVISNDPDDLLDPANDSDATAKRRREVQRKEQLKKARASVNRSEPVTDIVTPVTTVANTRTAHAILGVDQLRSSLREAIPGCDVWMTHVRVWPQHRETSNRSRAVSMSWWLSTPIQRHLHQQTEGTKNENENDTRLQTVWKAMQTTSSCGSSRRP